MSVLNKNISYYPSITEPENGVVVNLLSVLKSQQHKVKIEELRSEKDKKIQLKLKAKLPCYTVAGTFSRREECGLLMPSRLAAIDLDEAEYYDPLALMRELTNLPYIAYCGLSCRGSRLFCIVPFATENYNSHYHRLIQSFEDIGLPMGDKCHQQIAQPRFVSYNTDETQYFNHNAQPYDLLIKEKPMIEVHKVSDFAPPPSEAFDWCVKQMNKRLSFVPGKRHYYIVQLARYCNIKGILESETISGCLQFSREDFSAKEIEKIVKAIYKKQKSSYAKLPFIKK